MLLICRTGRSDPPAWLDEKTLGFELVDSGIDLTDITRTRLILVSDVWPGLEKSPVARGTRVIYIGDKQALTLKSAANLLAASQAGDRVAVTFLSANGTLTVAELPVQTRREIVQSSVELQRDERQAWSTARPRATADCDETGSPFQFRFRVNENKLADSPKLLLTADSLRGQSVTCIRATIGLRNSDETRRARINLLKTSPQGRLDGVAGTEAMRKLLELVAQWPDGESVVANGGFPVRPLPQIRFEVSGGYLDAEVTPKQCRALKVSLRAYEAFGGVWPE